MCYIAQHGGARFSPHNAQLGLQQHVQSVHSFYSFGHQSHSSRSVITYHVLCSNEVCNPDPPPCNVGNCVLCSDEVCNPDPLPVMLLIVYYVVMRCVILTPS